MSSDKDDFDDFDFDDFEPVELEDDNDDIDNENLQDSDIALDDEDDWDILEDDQDEEGPTDISAIEAASNESDETAPDDFDMPIDDFDDDDGDDDFYQDDAAPTKKKSGLVLPAAVVALALAGAGGYYFLTQAPSTEPAASGMPVASNENLPSVAPAEPNAPPSQNEFGALPNPSPISNDTSDAVVSDNNTDFTAGMDSSPASPPSVTIAEPPPFENSASAQISSNDAIAASQDFLDPLMPMPSLDNSNAEPPPFEDAPMEIQEPVNSLSALSPKTVDIADFQDTSAVDDGPIVDAAPDTPIEINAAETADIPVEPAQAPAPLAASNAEAELEISRLQKENGALQGQLTRAETAKNNVEQNVNRLKSEVSALESQIAALKDELSAAKRGSAERKSNVSNAPQPTPKAAAPKTSVAKKKSAPKAAKPKAITWQLRSANPQNAVISPKGSSDMRSVEVGDTVAGLGKISFIGIRNGRWVVVGSSGSVTQ